jgi:hypothetical protein
LVFVAPDIVGRLLAARFVIGVVLLMTLTLPGMLRLLATSPSAALAALVICCSIATWGLCLGALCRNPRPFELLLVFAVYIATQGATLFDLANNPQATALLHADSLVPAWLLLAWAWPRLAARRA